MARKKTIEIRVNEDREITVSPTGVHVAPGDTLRWEIADADSFVLTFDDPRVVAERGHEIVGRAEAPRGGRKLATAEVTIDDRRGCFHYQVAMAVNGQVYVLAGCPSVHVS